MTARRDGDHYVINGTKTWISNGIEGSCFALLVKTDPEAAAAPQGHEPVHRAEGAGLPRRPQAREARLQVDRFGRAGLRGLPRSGRPPDRRASRARASTRRPAGSSSAASTSRRAASASPKARCRLATDYAQIRKTFGKPICEHQAIQLKLGEMATRARAARLLTLDAAARLRPRRALRHGSRHGEVLRLRGGAGELASSRMRIHGAYGYSKEYDIERLYRDAPLTCIGEGTNEMQRIIIAKQWIKRNAGCDEAARRHSRPDARAVRRRALRHDVPGRPRRRGDQGRERRDGGDPARQVGPHMLGARRQPVLPDLEPRQEERDARPQVGRGPRRLRSSW